LKCDGIALWSKMMEILLIGLIGIVARLALRTKVAPCLIGLVLTVFLKVRNSEFITTAFQLMNESWMKKLDRE
jgi:hypothetical protein